MHGAGNKKTRIMYMIRDALVNPRLEGVASLVLGEARSAWIQAGLLTPGSAIYRAFPIALSGFLRYLSPVTAAGPSPNCTEFPFIPKWNLNLGQH